MSRLSSLTASSSPRSPISKPSPSPTPGFPAPYPQDPSTYHRKLRAVFGELRGTMGVWDEVVGDGLKWGKGMVDEGTEMDNLLQMEEDASRPPMMPHWEAYLVHRTALEANFAKLNRLLQKLRLLVDTTDGLYLEALKLRPVEFSLVEPLWSETGTWTFEHFVESLSPLTTLHSLHLAHLHALLTPLLSPPPLPPSSPLTTFESQKLALEAYRDAATNSERHEWRDEWVEMVGVEMGGWEARVAGEEVVEEDMMPFSAGGGGGKKGKGRRSRGGSVEPGVGG